MDNWSWDYEHSVTKKTYWSRFWPSVLNDLSKLPCFFVIPECFPWNDMKNVAATQRDKNEW